MHTSNSLLLGKIDEKIYFLTLITFLLITNGSFTNIFSQTFVRVTDPTNPVTTTATDGNYAGAAWIDIDNDGGLDLYVTKNFLFRNIGGGNFERLNDFTSISANQLGNGTSWGDYDNDGDIDLFLSGNPSIVYQNDGTGSFTPVLDGPLGENADNRGWTGAWGDYNNDSFIDLVIAHPAGFLGSPSIPSRFFENNGDGRFTKIDSFEFTTVFAPYTVSTWSDYDLDGDYDLFIGSGPAGTAALDYLYDNTMSESGVADFERVTTAPIGTDLQDGQVWNWIDYDNDSDLDAMLTNYGGAPNRFYRNDNGSYTSLSNQLTLTGSYLGNSWGDFDNDGDLDVLLTNESSVRVFINNGDESFTQESVFNGGSRSASLGDYDNDGDLDFYNTAPGSNARGLYKNETTNGNNWIIFSLAGSISNKSAIGTKVKVKATINGNPVWQFREVSAQNNFNGHNSLRVHFGLGGTAMIDSVIIEWTSGESVVLTNVSSNDFYNVEEAIPAGYLSPNFSADVIKVEGSNAVNFTDLSIADPNQPITGWDWDFDNDGTVDAAVQNPSFTYSDVGTFSVSLTVSNGVNNETKTRTDYITVNGVTGVDELTGEIPDDFNLFQNYPNPFNPSTSIGFSVASESQVVLKVYNLLGKEVATLMNEKKTPGFYELNFGGEILSSGIYVYRLEAGSFSSSKKMILLK
jgi:PKD repeat protein